MQSKLCSNRTRGTPPWLWPHALGLDAPLVALVWQDFLARCFGIPVTLTGRAALLLTVWAVYLCDRLLDIRATPATAEAPPHRFCRQHRRTALALLTVVAAADLLICLLWLGRPILWHGLPIAAGVALYLDAFPFRRIDGASKPVAAAALFALGVFLAAWSRSATPLLLAPAAMFAALCLTNLTLIRAWEQQHRWRALLMGAAAATLAAACLWRMASTAHAPALWYAAVALGAAGLASLACTGNGLRRETRRTLADAALLSPLLLWTLAR